MFKSVNLELDFILLFLLQTMFVFGQKTTECEKWNQWESDATEKYQITQLDNYENDELKTNGTIIMMSLKGRRLRIFG